MTDPVLPDENGPLSPSYSCLEGVEHDPRLLRALFDCPFLAFCFRRVRVKVVPLVDDLGEELGDVLAASFGDVEALRNRCDRSSSPVPIRGARPAQTEEEVEDCVPPASKVDFDWTRRLVTVALD